MAGQHVDLDYLVDKWTQQELRRQERINEKEVYDPRRITVGTIHDLSLPTPFEYDHYGQGIAKRTFWNHTLIDWGAQRVLSRSHLLLPADYKGDEFLANLYRFLEHEDIFLVGAYDYTPGRKIKGYFFGRNKFFDRCKREDKKNKEKVQLEIS